MFEALYRYWWQPVIRGIIAIVLGILAFAMPGITLATLVIFFGAYMLVNGVFLTITSLGSRKEKEDWGLLLAEGLMSIVIGVITFVMPGITVLGLVIYIAAWALATGVLEVIAAVRLRKVMTHEVWLALSGVASIVFAFLLMLYPAAGALSLLWLIGIFAIVFGVFLTILGFEVHHHGRKIGAHA